MTEQRITGARNAIHATVYRTFLAVLSTHGGCGCLTDALSRGCSPPRRPRANHSGTAPTPGPAQRA